MPETSLSTPQKTTDTQAFKGMEELHIYSLPDGTVVLRQGANLVSFPQQLADDAAHLIMDAGRGDR